MMKEKIEQTKKNKTNNNKKICTELKRKNK